MELTAIEMDPAAARTAYEQYAAAVKERHNDEDVAIAAGYKALSEGKRLVNLVATLRAGGTTTVTYPSRWARKETTVTVPRLAAIRAGARVCFTEGIDREGGCALAADKHPADLNPANRRDRFDIASGTFDSASSDYRGGVRAIVPSIPPALRPKRGLHLYTILWEAEWAVNPVPPVDPALLRRLGGELYVLLGAWDLTELERSVLAGRV